MDLIEAHGDTRATATERIGFEGEIVYSETGALPLRLVLLDER